MKKIILYTVVFVIFCFLSNTVYSLTYKLCYRPMVKADIKSSIVNSEMDLAELRRNQAILAAGILELKHRVDNDDAYVNSILESR